LFGANGSVRQIHSPAFASFTFLQVFLFAKVFVVLLDEVFRVIKLELGRVLVSAERSDADLYQDKHTSCGQIKIFSKT
jgi:hypothetical protein